MGKKKKGFTIREPNGRHSRSPIKRGELAMYELTASQELVMARAQKIRSDKARQKEISGQEDLPGDPLGILLGHDKISRDQYDEGRKLEWALTRRFGAVHAAPCGLYREVVINAADSTDTTVYREPATDADISQSVANAYALLDSISRKTRDAVVNAIRYYNVGGHREIDIDRISAGLSRLLDNRWLIYSAQKAA